MEMPEGPHLVPVPLTDEEWRAIPKAAREAINENANAWEDFWDAVEQQYYDHNRIYSK